MSNTKAYCFRQKDIGVYNVFCDRDTIQAIVVMAMAISIMHIIIATNYDHHRDLYPPLNPSP